MVSSCPLWGHCSCVVFFFFFNDTATTEIYTLSLHDALPISGLGAKQHELAAEVLKRHDLARRQRCRRSEEHTSELQSLAYLVCRLLLEKKKKKQFNQVIKKKKKRNTYYI